uniref:Uncharacterized protein n=1 Tax=Cannabis sativa TaxID=3483 RepID=A0A803QS89_CANSA
MSCPKMILNCFVLPSWQVWYMRNGERHGKWHKWLADVIDSCFRYLQEYQGAPKFTLLIEKWRPPRARVVKINTDVEVNSAKGYCSCGVVARDDEASFRVSKYFSAAAV